MKSNIIKSFSVIGLFGTNDVHIPFKDNIKILAGENGLGKTQVLNIFYYTLTRNFFRLSEFNFTKLILVFSNHTIEISKSQIDELTNELFKHPIVSEFIEEFGHGQFEILRNKFIHSAGNRNQLERDFEFNSRYRKIPYHRIFRVFDGMESNKLTLFNSFLQNCEELIAESLGGNEIMYFPTYRRVEEDLHNLGYNEDDLNINQENTLIQFGMDDVKRRFKQIEDSIDILLKEGLAQFTKDILNVVIDESEPKSNFLDNINAEDVDIILSRVGNLLPQSQKESVKNIISNKTFKNPLSGYLLQKLIDIYEKQKELDNSVKAFRDVCNRYLINKVIFYDESAIKIYIKSNISGKPIKLNKLSSGEKQIISIFSKIYLSDKNKRFLVLFDEPELSLSLLWQKQLLPDIVNSNKCNFLLAVTHSPFIFDNHLDRFAVGLNEYVTNTDNQSFEKNLF